MSATLSPEKIDEIARAVNGAPAAWWTAECPSAAFGYEDRQAIYSRAVRMRAAERILTSDLSPGAKAFIIREMENEPRGRWDLYPTDLSDMATRALRTKNQFGKPRPEWQGSGDCPLRLKLKDAVSYHSTQEAYSDDSRTLIPAGNPSGAAISPAQFEACDRNIAEFFRRADTHTGLAGSGCNYSARLVREGDEFFVVLRCRASIAD